MSAGYFDMAADRLEHHTGFDRLEARGTLRIALKAAGVDPRSVTAEQLSVVFEKIMPGELETRGVSDAARACGAVIDDLAGAPAPVDESTGNDLDAVFRRLADG